MSGRIQLILVAGLSLFGVLIVINMREAGTVSDRSLASLTPLSAGVSGIPHSTVVRPHVEYETLDLLPRYQHYWADRASNLVAIEKQSSLGGVIRVGGPRDWEAKNIIGYAEVIENFENGEPHLAFFKLSPGREASPSLQMQRLARMLRPKEKSALDGSVLVPASSTELGLSDETWEPGNPWVAMSGQTARYVYTVCETNDVGDPTYFSQPILRRTVEELPDGTPLLVWEAWQNGTWEMSENALWDTLLSAGYRPYRHRMFRGGQLSFATVH